MPRLPRGSRRYPVFETDPLPGVRLLCRELAEPVGGRDAAVHQDVAAGDEPAVRSHEQRTDGADFVNEAGDLPYARRLGNQRLDRGAR